MTRDSDLDPFGPFARGEAPELELDLSAPDLAAKARAQGMDARPMRPPVAARRERLDEPEDAEPEPPPKRAVELARHTRPPGPFMEVPYAVRVYRRNRALAAKLPSLRRVCEGSEADLAAATLALGRALHDQRDHPALPQLGSLLRIADATRNLTGEHKAELERAREEARAKLERIEASTARAEQALQPLRERARELTAQIAVFQTDFDVASRAMSDAGRELSVLAKASAPNANRQIELEATRTLRVADARAAQREIDARRPELDAAEAKLAEHEVASQRAKQVMAETTASLRRTEELLAMNATDAKEAHAKALTELAEEAVRLGIDHTIAPSAARLARVRRETRDAQVREVEMHELALTLHHPRSLRRGLILAGILALVTIGLMLFAALR